MKREKRLLELLDTALIALNEASKLARSLYEHESSDNITAAIEYVEYAIMFGPKHDA